MRIFLDIGLLVAVLFAVMAIVGQCQAVERYKIYDDRNRQTGDIYDPGHGRRLQIRDNNRRIIGYIEKSGKTTDTRRRKVKEIELDKK